MSWARLDDHAPSHPKVAVLGDQAFRLWVRAICYSSVHGTDGRVPKAVLGELGARAAAVRQLTAAPPPPYEHPLWTDGGDHYRIHDYLDYQPSRQQRAESRRQTRERVGRYRSRGHGNGVTNAVGNGDGNGVSNGVGTPAPTPAPTPTDKQQHHQLFPTGEKKLTKQQAAVAGVGGLYERFELAPPAPSLAVQWWKRCGEDLPALLARLEEVCLRGSLQAAKNPTSYAGGVVSQLAKELAGGRRPEGAWRFEEGGKDPAAVNGAGGDAALEHSYRRAILNAGRERETATTPDRRQAAEERLRGLCEPLGWPIPSAAELDALEAKLYAGGGAR